MTDQTDTGPRGPSLLDAFAKATERPQESAGALVTTGSAALPVERVVGAVKVQVPRDEHKILEKIRVLAAAQQDWIYRFPVKKKDGGTEHIEGPTIGLANNIARLFGNCEVDTRVTDLGDSWLIYARFTDYETGFVMTRPFQQRKGQRGMRTSDERGLDIAFQIGASKAIRNVIVNALQPFADFALEEARGALVQRIGKNIEGWRERCLQRIAEEHIELPRVERAIGRVVKDWTAPDIARVVAMVKSVQDGMTTSDEQFPPVSESAPSDDRATAAEPSHDGGAGDQAAGAKVSSSLEEQSARGPDANEGMPSKAQVDEARARAPLAEAIAKAYERGQAAKAAGHARKAIPPEYREASRSKEGVAWYAGYDGGEMPK